MKDNFTDLSIINLKPEKSNCTKHNEFNLKFEIDTKSCKILFIVRNVLLIYHKPFVLAHLHFKDLGRQL